MVCWTSAASTASSTSTTARPGSRDTVALSPLRPRARCTLAEQPPQGIERVMLAEDKLPVVLAVVLIVWAGLLLVMIRTERRLARIERALAPPPPPAA